MPSPIPNSPNVYDSLADAYLAGGQKDLARHNAQKALDLLPSDTSDPSRCVKISRRVPNRN